MPGDACLTEGGAVEPIGRTVVSRYRLRSLLGRGGMSRVWLADDEVLGRPVALKQALRGDLMPMEERAPVREYALREARAAARIRHAGAVTVYDIVEDAGLVWVVMEPLSGCTLEGKLKAEGPLLVREVARIGLCLLDVLRATHEAGVVHRDVKPGNVYLCDDGRVVLTDFGIARTVDDEATIETGEFLGSPAYVAPERVRGDDVGPASDLFSLGATLFAAVEGRPPFVKDSTFATLFAVLEDEPGQFRHGGPLRSVIVGLLAKDPEQRLSADAARAALEAIRSGT